jgi:hypothetical protein
LRDVTNEIAEVAKHYHFSKTPSIVEDLIKQFWQIVRALLEWWNSLTGPHASALDSRNVSTLLQVVIYVATGCAMVALVVLLYRRARTAGGDKKRTTKGASAVEEILDARGWRTQAEKLAGTGDYKGACRAVYLCLLQSLHENEIARFAPAKTNYEYSYTLAKYPDIQTPFRDLAERVELIWFGNKQASREDYDVSIRQLDGLSGDIKRVAALKVAQKLDRP